MIISIHQPQYLPWLGLIERIARSDIFVLLDNVPYSKNYFYNRNRIKTANGWIWLTIPVLFSGKYGQLIKDIRIDNKVKWREDHWKSIYFAYKKAPSFESYQKLFEEYYSRDWESLAEAGIESMRILLEQYGIKTRLVRASELSAQGQKEELLINICRELGADEYLSGPDGRNYLNLEEWESAGINVEFQEFRHPLYSQLQGEFIPQMSALDLLFNCGEKSCPILLDEKGEKVECVLK